MQPTEEQITLPPASDGERIVAALIEKGRLKETDLVRAQRLQEETGGELLALIARLGLVSERDHAEACAEVLGLPLVAIKDLPDLPPEGVDVSLRFMKQFAAVPVGESDAHVDRADGRSAGRLRARRDAAGDRREVRPLVGLRSEIDDLIERWHGQGRSAMGTIVENRRGREPAMSTMSSTCATSPPKRRSSAW